MQEETQGKNIPDPLLTPGDAARMLGVTTETLLTWADEGKLPCTKTLGGNRRYPLSAIQAMIKITNQKPPAAELPVETSEPPELPADEPPVGLPPDTSEEDMEK